MIKHIEKKMSDNTYVKGCVASRKYMGEIYGILANSTFNESEELNDFLMEVEDRYPRVAYLTVLTVDFSDRGKGYGSELLDYFLSETKEADIVFLVAGLNIPQRTGIDLRDFYQKRGFSLHSPDSYDTHEMFILTRTKKAR